MSPLPGCNVLFVQQVRNWTLFRSCSFVIVMLLLCCWHNVNTVMKSNGHIGQTFYQQSSIVKVQHIALGSQKDPHPASSGLKLWWGAGGRPQLIIMWGTITGWDSHQRHAEIHNRGTKRPVRLRQRVQIQDWVTIIFSFVCSSVTHSLVLTHNQV